MPQCAMCFQHKQELITIHPDLPPLVCKACGYKVNAVVGFMEYHGLCMVYRDQQLGLPKLFEAEMRLEAPVLKSEGKATDLNLSRPTDKKKR